MRKSLNHIFVAPLIFILALTPFFFGGHRPFFWAFWAAVCLVLAILNLYLLAREKVPNPPFNSTTVLLIFLFFVVISVTIIQVFPIGRFVGDFRFITRDGIEIYSNSLSLTPGDSLLGGLRWLTYGILFWLTLQVSFRNEARSRMLLRAVVIICSLYAIYGVLALQQLGDTILTLDKWAYLGSATGPFVNRNTFATFLGIGAVVSLCFLLERPNGTDTKNDVRGSFFRFFSGRKPLILGCLLVMCLALFMTKSRMGFFSAMIGLITVIAIQIRLKTLLYCVLAFVPVLLMAIFVSGDTGSLFDRLLFTSENLDSRIDLYSDVVQMIISRPLTGYGLGSFEYAYPLFHSDEVSSRYIWQLAHSTYLANWSDLGLVFGSIPLLIFAIIGFTFLRSILAGHIAVELHAAFGCLVVVALHSILDFSMEIHAVPAYMAVILSLGYAATVRLENNTEKDERSQ